MEDLQVFGSAIITIKQVELLFQRRQRYVDELDKVNQEIIKRLPDAISACDLLSCTVEDTERRETLQKIVDEMKKAAEDIK